MAAPVRTAAQAEMVERVLSGEPGRMAERIRMEAPEQEQVREQNWMEPAG